MICQSCGKKQAVTKIKVNVNGNVSEYNLCADCAQKMGYQSKNEFFNPFLDLNSLLGSFFGKDNTAAETVEHCRTCGASFYDISHSGKVGCADCYTLFRDKLMPSIQRIHGNTRHIGKDPTGRELRVAEESNLAVAKEPGQAKNVSEKAGRIEALQKELQKAVEEQNFEQAAVLRDQIRELEGKGGGQA